MVTILVANPKGGSGKSTLSVHLASAFAHREEHVYLTDLDPQKSCTGWLQRRPAMLPRISLWTPDSSDQPSSPSGQGFQIVDTPAAFPDEDTKRWLKLADYVLIPMAPSAFDWHASERYLEALLEMKRIRQDKVAWGVIGMRVADHTKAAADMRVRIAEKGFPLIACLRETQRYVQTIQAGMTIFDLPRSAVAQDLAQWQSIFDWFSPSRHAR